MPNKSWIVRMECTVIKDVVVESCTEDEAQCNPWGHVVSEIEVEQKDWKVISVEENN